MFFFNIHNIHFYYSIVCSVMCLFGLFFYEIFFFVIISLKMLYTCYFEGVQGRIGLLSKFNIGSNILSTPLIRFN